MKIRFLFIALAGLLALGAGSSCNKTDEPTKTVAVTGVSLDRTTFLLDVGVPGTLTATISPETATNKEVAWSSSDDTIATIDADGVVTAVKAGSVRITATTADGGKTATCTVTVLVTGGGDEPTETVAVTEVTLNKTTLSLEAGAIEILTPTVAPETATNKAVKWSTSDATIATVSANGKVTAVKNGSATITVTTVDGAKTADCVVNVITPVTGVSLNKSTLSLVVGNTETLTATIAPEDATNKSVTWTSSDDTVASVGANGLVTAIKEGSTTITVTTADGNFTATCDVTVIAKPIPVTGVGLNKSTLSLTLGATETLTATVAPETATNKAVTWSTGDSETATVSADGLVTALKEGTVTITVTTADGAKTAACTVTISGVLINGVIWATANVDAPGTFAASPEAYGMLYQWGTKVGWSSTDPLTSSSDDTTWVNYTASGGVWASENNPCPTGWQVASKTDYDALLTTSKVSKTWITEGVYGVQFVDLTSQQSIFIAAAGYRNTSGTLTYSPSIPEHSPNGRCWAVTSSNATSAYRFRSNASNIDIGGTTYSSNAMSIRCTRSAE
jgi:uncharacterized protein (TIGR02145 family)